jgi:hypothetical protein
MWTDHDGESKFTWAKSFTADPTGYLHVDPSTGFLKQGNFGEWGFTKAAIEKITGKGIDTEWEITIEMQWDRYENSNPSRGNLKFEMGIDCDTSFHGYATPNAGYARYPRSIHINSNHMTTPMYCPVFQGGYYYPKNDANLNPWYQALHPTVAVPTLPGKDPASGKDAHLICIKDGNGKIPETYGNLMGAPGLTHKIVIKRDMTHTNKGMQVDIVHPSGKSMLYGGIFLKKGNFDIGPKSLPFCFYNANFETTFMSVQSTGA